MTIRELTVVFGLFAISTVIVRTEAAPAPGLGQGISAAGKGVGSMGDMVGSGALGGLGKSFHNTGKGLGGGAHDLTGAVGDITSRKK